MRLNSVKQQARPTDAVRAPGERPILPSNPNSAQNGMPAPQPDENQPKPARRERKAAPESAAVSAAQRLLDAKRRKSGGN